MQNIFLTIAFVILNIKTCLSILIETTGKDMYCYYKHITQGDTIHVSYIISGENEEKVNSVLEVDHKIIYHHESAADGDFKHQADIEGMYKLCFLPLSTNPYYISFEFFTEHEKGHTLDMAKDEHIHDMKSEVQQLSLIFEEVEKNVRFNADRRKVHNEVVGEITTQIRHITYMKIFVVILVSLFQVFLIHRFFGGSKKASVFNFPSSSNMFDSDRL